MGAINYYLKMGFVETEINNVRIEQLDEVWRTISMQYTLS